MAFPRANAQRFGRYLKRTHVEVPLYTCIRHGGKTHTTPQFPQHSTHTSKLLCAKAKAARDQATCFSSFALSEATLSESALEMISSATMRPDLVRVRGRGKSRR